MGAPCMNSIVLEYVLQQSTGMSAPEELLEILDKLEEWLDVAGYSHATLNMDLAQISARAAPYRAVPYRTVCVSLRAVCVFWAVPRLVLVVFGGVVPWR